MAVKLGLGGELDLEGIVAHLGRARSCSQGWLDRFRRGGLAALLQPQFAGSEAMLAWVAEPPPDAGAFGLSHLRSANDNGAPVRSRKKPIRRNLIVPSPTTRDPGSDMCAPRHQSESFDA